MWQEVLIPLSALVASLLTFLSGFGLGTLLLPVFAIYFPIELAVGLTAVVHLLNNLFKLGLLWRATDLSVLLRFGVPSMIGAWFGASLFTHLSGDAVLYQGFFGPVGVTGPILGVLMIFFAWMELGSPLERANIPPAWLVPGGLISGSFGGFSGHQGAFRSIFLLRAGLGKESFLATGVCIAVLVDLTRIPIYARDLTGGVWRDQGWLLLFTVSAALVGAVAGKSLLPKITVRAVRMAVAALLVVIAGSLLTGAIG